MGICLLGSLVCGLFVQCLIADIEVMLKCQGRWHRDGEQQTAPNSFPWALGGPSLSHRDHFPQLHLAQFSFLSYLRPQTPLAPNNRN